MHIAGFADRGQDVMRLKRKRKLRRILLRTK